MRRVAVSIAIAVVLAACGGARPMSREAEPLADHDPYAFHRAIGVTLLRTEQPRRALPHLKRLLELRPRDPEAPYLVGRAYMEMQLWDAARGMFKRAIALDSSYAPAYSMLGVVYDSSLQHQRAEVEHRRAIALDGHRAAYYNNLGFSLYLSGRYRGALRAYKKALALDASKRRIHNNLGFTYGKLGDMSRAWRHFQLGGSMAEAKNNLGLVYAERGNLKQAVDLYVQALSTDPDLTEARGNLKRACKKLGRPVPDIPTPTDEPVSDIPTPKGIAVPVTTRRGPVSAARKSGASHGKANQ